MSDERQLLAQAMRVFGQDGKLVIFKDSEDPFGQDRDPVLHSYADPDEGQRSPLSRWLAEVNARSRGERL